MDIVNGGVPWLFLQPGPAPHGPDTPQHPTRSQELLRGGSAPEAGAEGVLLTHLLGRILAVAEENVNHPSPGSPAPSAASQQNAGCGPL